MRTENHRLIRLPGRVSGLARDARGATIVEFAFVAPVFLVLLFGLIQAGLTYWTKSTLDEVAYSTARCMSVDSACASSDAQRAFAFARAAAYGVTVATSEVSVASGTTCKGDTNANAVTITHAVASPLKRMVPFLPYDLVASACFPVVG